MSNSSSSSVLIIIVLYWRDSEEAKGKNLGLSYVKEILSYLVVVTVAKKKYTVAPKYKCVENLFMGTWILSHFQCETFVHYMRVTAVTWDLALRKHFYGLNILGSASPSNNQYKPKVNKELETLFTLSFLRNSVVLPEIDTLLMN